MMNALTKKILIGAAAGLVASWIKTKIEPPLQKIGESKYPPTPQQLSLKGADVTHQPENMPPAILANQISQILSDRELTKEEKIQYMTYIHYALGAMVGISYIAFIERYKKINIDQGVTAGLVVWLLTHGTTVPALGLQGKVKQMPKSWWVWELGSHILFGIALEQSRKWLRKWIG